MVSSQLLRVCPWFWPCTTSQPETEAHCPAWTEFPPDSPTYAKGFRHIEPTLAGKHMLSESGNTKSWWYFPEDSEDSGHNDLVKQRYETIIVQTSLMFPIYCVMKYLFFFVFSFQRVKYILDVFVHVYLGYYIVEDLIYIFMIHEWPQS